MQYELCRSSVARNVSRVQGKTELASLYFFEVNKGNMLKFNKFNNSTLEKCSKYITKMLKYAES